MKVYVNERRMRRKRLQQAAGIMMNTTLVLVSLFAAALIVVFLVAPSVASSPFLIIALGLISTFIGLQAGNQLTKLPEPHQVLGDALKGIAASSVLYHYYLPAEHVLVTPEGVFTLTPVRQETNMTFGEGRHTVHDSFPKRALRLLTRQAIGHPLREAQRDAARLQGWLADHLETEPVDVQPLLVFLHPDAQFEIEGEPGVPILRADKRKPSLKSYVKDYAPAGRALTTADVEALNRLLDISS